jgi:hypothetical protein
MKLIDKILKRFGYVKIPPFTPLIKKEEYELQVVKLEYDISPLDFINSNNIPLSSAQYEEQKTYDFLRSLVPFIEKRWYQGHDLYRPDVRRYELRILVAKPKTSS